MGVKQHSRAPWRKLILIPCWTVQLVFMAVIIVLLGLAIGVLNGWDNDTDRTINGVIIKGDAVNKAAHVVAPIWISLTVACAVLAIVEIVLLVIHKLKPLTFLIINMVKTGIWTTLFIFDIIAEENNSSVGTRTTVGGIILDAILLLSFWIPLVYGGIIFHRTRMQKKFYKPIDLPLDLKNTTYPPQFVPLSTAKGNPNVESFEPIRTPNYNHVRDTRFDLHRSYSDERGVSPDIPEVNVHDDMGARRSLSYGLGSSISFRI